MEDKTQIMQQDSADTVLVFSLRGKKYAVPAAQTVSVITLHRSLVFKVPFDTSGKIRGIFNYKGTVTAIVGGDSFACDADSRGDESLTAAILQDGDRFFAVLVDSAEAATAQSCENGVIPTTAQRLYQGEL